ncbi:MAG: DUF1549 domain-containing protein, partial [Planctomycetota bacterium]
MKRNSKIAALVITLHSLFLAQLSAEDDRKGLDFFEAKIRPLLIRNCYGCHSAGAAAKKKLKANLYLDSREGMLRGGESGPVLVPGRSSESLIVKALRHESVEMPPSGKLADPLIEDVARWIDMGAPDPRRGTKAHETGSSMEQRIERLRDYWSMRPLRVMAPPNVKDPAWVRTSVDRFVRAAQEAKGIDPSAIADPRTLLRRLHYDLLGLPPEPELVESFVAAAKKDFDSAWRDLVDRLLLDSDFGARQARHWLDLVRFAESNGYAFDGDRPNAFRYRDFVIKAFAEDMPYDEFVKVQLAGDLLRPADVEAVSATGFLVAGPYTTQQTMKERERSRYEQLDDMIHTLGTAMLGLSVGCARCHDHKYDPIPQRDYYRFAAIFREVGFSNVGVDRDPEKYGVEKAKYDAGLEKATEPRTKYEAEVLPGHLDQWIAARPKDPPEPLLENWFHIGPFGEASFDAAFDNSFLNEKEKIDRKAAHLDGKVRWVERPEWKDATVLNPFNAANSAKLNTDSILVRSDAAGCLLRQRLHP